MAYAIGKTADERWTSEIHLQKDLSIIDNILIDYQQALFAIHVRPVREPLPTRCTPACQRQREGGAKFSSSTSCQDADSESLGLTLERSLGPRCGEERMVVAAIGAQSLSLARVQGRGGWFRKSSKPPCPA